MTDKRHRLGVIMDSIASINFKKDTTLAFLLEAQARGYEISYLELDDLFISDGTAMASARALCVKNDATDWFKLEDRQTMELGDLGIILMRKDPPFDMEYVYATYILELAEKQGARVVNKPSSLRDVNEKVFIQHFPECSPPTLVTRDSKKVVEFLDRQKKIVVKPLDGMGGKSVFVVANDDPNLNVILETLTVNNTQSMMAQKFIPEISSGDKRILLVEGRPIPHALARIPREGESRGNLAVGARAEGVELTARDNWICAQVADTMREKGLLFVGLDVIGDYLTEINVTSPTCVRELDAIYGINISATLFDALEKQNTS